VTPTIADFTTANPNEYEQVTALLVDPSCSGSGIFDRSSKQEYDEARLLKLSSFQFTIMKHALSFPNAKRVIYSTCSIHAQENERVVGDLLVNPDIKEAGWRLAKRSEILPTWERRGITEEFGAEFDNPEELAGGCVRVLPKVDGGIGFFAALFIRDNGEEGLENGKKEEEEAKGTEEIEANLEEADKEELDGSEIEEEEWTGFED
jgi:putative methyltransferase